MNDEMTINLELKDLGMRILKKWKWMFLCLFIGGALFGLLGAAKNYHDYHNAIQMKQESEKTIDLKELQKSLELTDWEVSEIELAAESYTILREEYEDTLNYISNSPVMQLDANNCSYMTIQYGVTVEDAVYPVITLQDDRAAILGAYALELTKGENKESFASILMPDVDPSYVNELVSVSCDTNKYVLAITLYGGTRDACEEVAQLLDAVVTRATESVKEVYGEFEIFRVGANYYENVANATLLSTQQSWYNTVYSLRNSMYSVTNTLGTSQKEYYYALLAANTEAAAGEMVGDQPQEGDPAGYSLINTKMIVVGAVLGLFAACAWICLRYFLSKKLRLAADIKYTFGLLLIGEHGINDTEHLTERVNIWSSILQMNCEKNGYRTLFLMGAVSDEAEMAIARQLAAVMKEKGIELGFGPSATSNAESAEQMAQVDAVVLLERIDVSTYAGIRAECDICRQSNLPILGAIVVR